MVQFIKQRIFNFASKCFGNTPNNSSGFFLRNNSCISQQEKLKCSSLTIHAIEPITDRSILIILHE